MYNYFNEMKSNFFSISMFRLSLYLQSFDLDFEI